MNNAPTTRETADHAELAACPFCGGAAEIVHIEEGENQGGSCVCCTACQASGNLEFGRKENFTSNWNRRRREAALLSEIAALRGERDRLRNAASKSNEEVCQSLGKALGYPWFKDDQANFPGSTEEHGVCVGDHVAESIADEASRRLTQAERQRDELRKALELAAIRFDEIYEAAEVDDIAYRNEATIHGINGNADVAQSEVRQALANQGADQ